MGIGRWDWMGAIFSPACRICSRGNRGTYLFNWLQDLFFVSKNYSSEEWEIVFSLQKVFIFMGERYSLSWFLTRVCEICAHIAVSRNMSLHLIGTHVTVAMAWQVGNLCFLFFHSNNPDDENKLKPWERRKGPDYVCIRIKNILPSATLEQIVQHILLKRTFKQLPSMSTCQMLTLVGIFQKCV